MAHGGTNFGFYSGANTGANEHDYKPDLTSYDYVRKIDLVIWTYKPDLTSSDPTYLIHHPN